MDTCKRSASSNVLLLLLLLLAHTRGWRRLAQQLLSCHLCQGHLLLQVLIHCNKLLL
jgi:hypothetical protein